MQGRYTAKMSAAFRRLLTCLLPLLLVAGPAHAKVRLGDPLPAHPWQTAASEVVVVYAQSCEDPAALWQAVGQLREKGLPVRAVFAEGAFSAADAPPATSTIHVWRGADALAFARQLRVAHYPTLLRVDGGHLLGVWEGQPDRAGRWRAALGLD